MESVVHHRGRRYKRSSTKKSDPNDHAQSTDHGIPILPPPTPPTGKTRTHMIASQQFQYQRFKPLPSIGTANNNENVPITNDTDSAVDLTSPPPSSIDNRVYASSHHTRDLNTSSDPTQLCLRGDDVERDGVNVYSAPQVSRQKTPINKHSRALTVSSDPCVAVEEGNRTSFKMLSHSLPPEPSPNDAHTVTLCIRLTDGTRIQRRFNFCVDTLQTVVTFAHLNLHHKEEGGSEEQDDFDLCDNSVPRVVFEDLSLRLVEVGLVHNTMLQFINRVPY